MYSALELFAERIEYATLREISKYENYPSIFAT